MKNPLKRFGAITAVGALLAAGLVAGIATSASADEGCTPKDAVPAYTEVVPDINHPAEYETVVTTPAVEASTKWWAFAPNEKGKFDGTPVFPDDPNGTWEGPKTEGGPQQDKEGVYQNGNGNGDWFYRENTEAQDAVTEQRLVKDAWVEVVPDIEHPAIPAVTCEDTTPTPPAAVSCVPTGNWYTEDAAPVQTDDGLYFEGQGKAVDWYQYVTGNLQGLGSQSLTFAQVQGYQPSFTIVFFRNTTGPNTGYANLVAEWYMNGGSPSTNGTFSVTPSTLFWTNKITSGAGSQGDPQPLSFFSNLWPNNSLISLGAHLGSAQTSETHSLVTAVGGCVTANFVPAKPPVKPDVKSGTDETTTAPVCVQPLDGTATVQRTETPWTQDYALVNNEWVLQDKVYGEPVTTTDTITSEACEAVVVVTPPVDAVCSDFLFQENAQTAFDSDKVGFASLDADGDGVACEELPGTPVVKQAAVVAAPSTDTLASTGGDGSAAILWGVGGFGLLVLGLVLTAWRRALAARR